MTDAADQPDELIAIMEELRDCPAEYQHAELAAWARSPWWHPLLMMALGWHGEIARAAWIALKSDMAADTPGRRWDQCDPTLGRASIVRLLGLEGHQAAYYASSAFRTWVDDDDLNWIAGAIGAQPLADTEASVRWCHLDIRDVILWNPRTNEARLAGEHKSTSTYVLPSHPVGPLTVWADCGAFFRAWAANRARTGSLIQKRAAGEWAHPIAEPDDGNLPGGLLIGSIHRARWPSPPVEQVLAAEGLTGAELHFAAVHAASLPGFGTA